MLLIHFGPLLCHRGYFVSINFNSLGVDKRYNCLDRMGYHTTLNSLLLINLSTAQVIVIRFKMKFRILTLYNETIHYISNKKQLPSREGHSEYHFHE